ncbi:AraC family transcriptional regulator [Paenibacillus sp. H1-7]|uniref:helix-turn-helix domain-containing protein n=1 Tax=Paenibacillus sp. H1-7 TaxID=2282849 RepID=UPI001EF9658B|nr:AraC family transcriptional regulator [Paenibacillus sp. H1-7]ULL17069.1 AraC family transcriptional regulator [Paenibacillus sp. H1-7]
MSSLNIFNELAEHVMLHIFASREVIHPLGWVENKQHVDYDLWYLHEGKIEIVIHDQVHLASGGDLVLFSPKVAYTARNLDASCRFTYTHFDFGLGNHHRILEHFELAGVIGSSLVQEEIRLFLETYEQYKREAPMSGIRLKGCLTILIAKIIECYGHGEYRGGFTSHAPRRKRSANLETLQPVFDFIHERLHQPLRIGELAELAGMSEKYFINYFKQALGVTPGLYIYQLKMNHARELLYSKRYTIQQIAGMLGYPDPFSFSKSFKKYYKVPPSQFVL